jgi:hypothetical protein
MFLTMCSPMILPGRPTNVVEPLVCLNLSNGLSEAIHVGSKEVPIDDLARQARSEVPKDCGEVRFALEKGNWKC